MRTTPPNVSSELAWPAKGCHFSRWRVRSPALCKIGRAIVAKAWIHETMISSDIAREPTEFAETLEIPTKLAASLAREGSERYRAIRIPTIFYLTGDTRNGIRAIRQTNNARWGNCSRRDAWVIAATLKRLTNCVSQCCQKYSINIVRGKENSIPGRYLQDIRLEDVRRNLFMSK